MRRMTLMELVARLEGAYEHLATKADVAELRGELKTEIAKAQASTIRWMIGTMGVFAGIVVAVDRLLG